MVDQKIQAPQRLSTQNDVDSFGSGVESLDRWLKKRAAVNEKNNASRTYVVCVDNKVIGYYALAVGSVRHDELPSRIKRNMPNPVPVMILARLAVDSSWQGRGIGSGMLQDAILRTLNAAEIAGIKAILVHAIDDVAKQFYAHHGFRASPVEPRTLMITLKEVLQQLEHR